jgi:hypothetical protein
MKCLKESRHSFQNFFLISCEAKHIMFYNVLCDFLVVFVIYIPLFYKENKFVLSLCLCTCVPVIIFEALDIFL